MNTTSGQPTPFRWTIRCVRHGRPMGDLLLTNEPAAQREFEILSKRLRFGEHLELVSPDGFIVDTAVRAS